MAVLSSDEPITDWASNSVLCTDGSLDYYPPEVSGNMKLINILADDVSSTTNKWNCAAIAQFLGNSNCFLDEVKNFAETKWNDLGLLEVHKLDNELFVFRFQSEESKIKVLEEPLVFFGSKMMFLRPWVPNKPIQKLTLRTVPVWIKLPGLGFQYFSLKALSKLGSLLGRPLFVDKSTAAQSRLDYARMCVEVKADEQLPKEIIFLNEFGVEIVQKVEYEWIPSRCTICKIFGHTTADTDLCTRKEMSDLKAQGDSHDMKSEQLGINADSEKVGPKASCKDDKRCQEKNLLPEEKKIPRNKLCPCGSNKKYKACCESTCEDEGVSQEKKSLVPEKKDEAPKKKVEKTHVHVSEPVYGAMAAADVEKAVEKAFERILQDRVMEETKNKKNAVEAYVYDMRNKLNDKYIEFVVDSEKEQLVARLQEVEDWLYEDGEDETKGVYIAKLDELKKQGDPIEERYKEYTERESVIDQLMYCIYSYRDAAVSNNPNFDHIDIAEKHEVYFECVEAEVWLRERKKKQDALPKYANPVLLSADLRRKTEALDRFCRPIMTKPRYAN